MTEDIYQVNIKNLKKVTFILIYALFAFYFLVNGEGLFDRWDEGWTYSTIIYLVGVSLFLSIQEKIPEDLESKKKGKTIASQLVGFSLAFLIATGIFILLYDAGVFFQDVEPSPSKMIPALVVYQLVIVCASEEIIFRGVLYKYFRMLGVYPAVLISSIIFAVFHYFAYSGSVQALGMAFVMGCIFALCVERWNLGVSIGLHFAWNAFILGVTALVG